MRKYNYYCDVCGIKLVKQNRIRNKTKGFADIIAMITLDFEYFVDEKYEDRICKRCDSVLKNTIKKLRNTK